MWYVLYQCRFNPRKWWDDVPPFFDFGHAIQTARSIACTRKTTTVITDEFGNRVGDPIHCR